MCKWVLIAMFVAASGVALGQETKPRAARSVHLGYPAPAALAFYNEITVEQSVPGSYFMACGFNHGYFGIQEQGKGKKVVIFSIWDPTKGDNANTVPLEERVEILYKADDVLAKRFGGEGTGGQSFFDHDWKIGQTCRFLVVATVQDKKTAYAGYFWLAEKNQWKHLVTFRTRTGGEELRGFYSFIEDFRRDTKSATEARRATFGNGWVMDDKGEWKPLTKARFTASGATWEAKDTIDAGVAGNVFYLQTGGDTKTSNALNSTITRPTTDAKPPQLPAQEVKMNLWNGDAPMGDGTLDPAKPAITIHLPPKDKANGAAMVICPGGGYGGLVTGAEGHGIAQWAVDHGIAGIVLEYRLPHGRAMVPLLDAQRAIRITRANANEWNIDPNRVGIIGFSAGGHLASTAGTHFDAGEANATDPIEKMSSRPDFMILVYPVISMGPKGHGGSRDNLLGKGAKEDLVEKFSNEKQVSDKTPPAFLAHAKDDTLVTPENSRIMYEALLAHHIPAEYLELPNGGHGLNGYKGPSWDAWQKRSMEWLGEQKIIPATNPASEAK
jgi:acetyl esterase/lipase